MSEACPSTALAADVDQTAVPIDLLSESAVPQEPGYDAALHGTNDSWARGQYLALRPREFSRNGRHPDQRPCPPWCVGARYAEHEHEIDVESPLVARHSINGGISSIASKYPGRKDDAAVETASLYSDLTQQGQGEPEITVLIRQFDRDGRQILGGLITATGEPAHGCISYDDFVPALRLSVEDATELVTVLTYLVQLTRVGGDR